MTIGPNFLAVVDVDAEFRERCRKSGPASGTAAAAKQRADPARERTQGARRRSRSSAACPRPGRRRRTALKSFGDRFFSPARSSATRPPSRLLLRDAGLLGDPLDQVVHRLSLGWRRLDSTSTGTRRGPGPRPDVGLLRAVTGDHAPRAIVFGSNFVRAGRSRPRALHSSLRPAPCSAVHVGFGMRDVVALLARRGPTLRRRGGGLAHGAAAPAAEQRAEQAAAHR